jgi:hypothetical protein
VFREETLSHLDSSGSYEGPVFVLVRVPYLLALSFSFSTVLPYAVEGASYLDRVVGDEGSSRELRRGSEAAVSFKIPVRVDEETGELAAVVGLVATGAGFTFGGSSSSDSSSELVSSSDDSDSSFLAAGAVAAGVELRNRL